MISKRKAGLVLIIIFIMIVNFTVNAYDQSMTRHIENTNQDIFVLDTGISIDTNFVTVLSPDMDIRGMLFFEDMKINYWEVLINATLRLRTFHGRSFDADSKITIYGVRDYRYFGYSDKKRGAPGSPSAILSLPLTSANVVYNTSQFYGTSWKEIDVTSLVNEMKADRHYDGPGFVASDRGDNMIFMIFGAEGHEPRSFYDFRSGNNLEAQLVLHWTDAATPPSGGVFNESYRGFNIFKVTDYGDPMFQVFGLDTVNDGWYFNVTKGFGSEIEWDTAGFTPSESGALDPILGLDPWTLIFADSGAAKVYVSNDEFVSSVGIDPGNQYNLAPWDGNIGSMVIDPDGETIHLVWSSPTPAFPGNYNIIYTNFTLNRVNGAITWAPSYTNVSAVAWSQEEPVIYVQPDGTLHVAWAGEQGTATKQIWYRRRAANGTWFDQLRISDSDVGGNPHSNADVLANDETGDALIVWNYDNTNVYWEMVFPNNTASPADRTVTGGSSPSMINDRENNVANLVYQTTGGNPIIRFRNMIIANGSTWSAAINISPAGQKHLKPDIGMNPANRTISVVWYNDWNVWVAANWWNEGQTPVEQKIKVTNVRLNYNYIEEETDVIILSECWLIEFINGTILEECLESHEDAIIEIDIFLGIDPAEPDPEGQEWDESGPFTRFKTRFYVLLIGLVLIFGPLFYWAMSRPSGYEFVIGVFIMVVGFALMYAAGQV